MKTNETSNTICIFEAFDMKALASSINIGTAVDEITRGEFTTNIGNMELNRFRFRFYLIKT